MKTTNQPTSHPRRVRTVFALAAMTMAITACGGSPSDPVPAPEFTRLCASGAEASNGVCAAPNIAPACTRDNLTGLVWEARASLAELSPSAPPNGLCGVANWRAPTVHELLTLDHAGNGDAARISRTFFPDLGGSVLELSTAEAYQAGGQWNVNFNGPMIAGAGSSPFTRWVSGPVAPTLTANFRADLMAQYKLADIAGAQAQVIERGPLMWLVLPDKALTTWDDAATYQNELNSRLPRGFNDWRLPTRLELDSLVNRAKSDPATDDDMKQQISFDTSYWSGSSTNNSEAWMVYFKYGDISERPKSEKARAIYVRR
jgi:hypothetical protein